MKFEFATAARIVFAPGAVARLPAIVREFGRQAMVVTGRDPARASRHLAGIEHITLAGDGEPTVDFVRRGAAMARECDVVIGIGGGSAIDGGKAIAALAANSGEPLDYLEVVGRSGALERRPLPFIAVPTTAGTGSEVTCNAVLGSSEHKVKASLRSAWMLPAVALVDPELTLDLPRAVTASTGLDALTQLIEPFVSSRANPMTDMFCREGIPRIAAALPRAWADGLDREAREWMSFASLLGGLSLANAGLGVVHGFAAPIGGQFDAPHGALCAALLPWGMRANIAALRAHGHAALSRYAEVARMLTGTPEATPENGVEWVRRLCDRLYVPPLGSYGIAAAHAPELVEKAAKASSMKANPVVLSTAVLEEVLVSAIG